MIARNVFMYTYFEGEPDKAESYDDTKSKIEDAELLCEDIEYKLSYVLDLINCDVKVQIFLRFSNSITPYIASNMKEMSQEKRQNTLSCVDDRHIVLSSKEVYFDELCATVKLFLLFDKSIYKRYINIRTYALSFDTKSNSFFEAVLSEFLVAFENRYVDFLADGSPYFSYYHMIQKAGSDFVGDISLILGYKAIMSPNRFDEKIEYYYPPNLLSYINDISLQKYETSVAKGKILLCQDYTVCHEKLDIDISANRASLNDLKKIRKLLEITRGDLILVIEDLSVSGFINQKKIHEISLANTILVEIEGTMEWNISIYENEEKKCLLCNKRNRFMYERKRVNKDYFANIAQKVLKNCNIDALWEIVNCAVNNSNHGTTIVFSNSAESEATRLEASSFKVKPQTLRSEIIKYISTIDGAILFDEQGVCYSIGAILDGVQTKDRQETMSNGARHNSAIRYLENNSNCLIVLISEDGDVKILSTKS